MPISGETEYTFRTPYPDVLKENADNTVKMPVYRSGALVEPTAYLFSLVSPNGTTLVNEATATPSGSVATYTIPAATLVTTADNVELGSGYQEVWKLTLGGVVHTVDRPAVLALRPIHPTVTDVDLEGEYTAIYRWTGKSEHQSYIDAAWHQILRRWIREGGVSYLVKEAYAFHDALLHLTLAKILAEVGAERENAEMTELANQHQDRYKAEWPQIVSSIDHDHDGRPDNPDQRQRAPTVVNRNTPRRPYSFRGRRMGY